MSLPFESKLVEVVYPPNAPANDIKPESPSDSVEISESDLKELDKLDSPGV